MKYSALWLRIGFAIVVLFAGIARAESRRFRVVCSTTQTADFTRQITGDDWEVFSILGPGVDPHGYQPVPSDSRLVASADLCVQNGLYLEGKNWMAALVRDNGQARLVTATEGIDPLELDYEGETVDDPHAWFDPRLAVVYVRNILEAIIEVDPSGESRYRARADLYIQQLRALDGWIQQQIAGIPTSRRILVTSHDAFNYFGARYGLELQSPVGWSTGSEIGGGMTPLRRRRVVQSIRESGVPAVFIETTVNPGLLEQIAKEANVVIGGYLYSDAMGEKGSAAETYIGMMRENTLTLVSALRGL